MRGHVAPGNQIVRFGLAAIVAMTMFVALAKTCKAQSTGEEVRRFELRIENGRLTNAVKTLQVRRGDAVELIWSADRQIVLHLHGYDIEIDVAPDHPTSLGFTANATGRFPIEIHSKEPHKQRPLAYIEVQPR